MSDPETYQNLYTPPWHEAADFPPKPGFYERWWYIDSFVEHWDGEQWTMRGEKMPCDKQWREIPVQP